MVADSPGQWARPLASDERIPDGVAGHAEHGGEAGHRHKEYEDWSAVAAPHAGAALDCEVAGWPPAGELAPGSGGADDPLHPVAAPISRMDTQANGSRIRPMV